MEVSGRAEEAVGRWGGRLGSCRSRHDRVSLDLRLCDRSFFFSSRRRHTRCSRDWSSDVCSSDLTCGASEPGALVTAFDTRAGVFDQPPVFDAGWAGGFTRAAVKTLFDVLDEPIADARFRNSLAGEFALKDVEHLLDAATRRIRLEIPQSIGGAGIEAKAAADAASVVLVDRRRARDRVYRHAVRC